MIKKSSQNREWYLIDAKEQILGRISTGIADILRGKNKASFGSNKDVGDCIVVVNAEKVKLSGNKENQKRYYKHTGYIGNLKVKTLAELRKTRPEEIIRHSVYGMLPKNKLREDFIARLKIYAGANHPHKNIKFKNQ